MGSGYWQGQIERRDEADEQATPKLSELVRCSRGQPE